MIEFSHYSFYHSHSRKAALTDITFSLRTGEAAALAGASGSGKSTLLQAASGFIPRMIKGQTEGSIKADGTDIASLPPLQRIRLAGLVGADPQKQLSGICATVREEVSWGLCNLGLDAGEIAERTAKALDELDLNDLAGRHPMALSDGQMQRLAVASVWVMRPRFLFLDEPAAFLDPRRRRNLIQLVLGLVSENHGLIWASSRLEEAASFKRWLVLEEGRLTYDGPPCPERGGGSLQAPWTRIWSMYAELSGKDSPPLPASETQTLERLQAAVRPSGSSAKMCGNDVHRKSGKMTASAGADSKSGTAGSDGTAPGKAAAVSPGDDENSVKSDISADGAAAEFSGSARLQNTFSASGSSVCAAAAQTALSLAFENVSCTYSAGSTALNDISLHWQAPECIALCGANGSGKTTLAKTACGLLRPDSGRVLVSGRSTAGIPPWKLAAQLGFVFRDPGRQIFSASVLDETAFGPLNLGLNDEEVSERCRRVLKLTGLWEARNIHPYELNGSQRRRLAWASILAMETPAVIMDEPTAGLDAEGRKVLLDVLNSLRKRGVLTVIITHDMDLAAEFCSRIAILSEGRLCAEGSPAEIFAAAQNAWQSNTRPAAHAKTGRVPGTAQYPDARNTLSLAELPAAVRLSQALELVPAALSAGSLAARLAAQGTGIA